LTARKYDCGYNKSLKYLGRAYTGFIAVDRTGILIRVFEGYDEKIVDKVIREIRE